LNGQYPTGVIDWGTNTWHLAGPYGGFATNSVSFNAGGARGASFSLVSPRIVVSVDLANGGQTPSTVSLSCSGQPTASIRLQPGQRATLTTAWMSPCSNVTVSSSNSWDTNFDNFVLR
jgi:hypothetical protein